VKNVHLLLFCALFVGLSAWAIQPSTNPLADLATPAPTSEAIATQPATTIIPLQWPLMPATDQQIQEAQDCDIDAVVTARYPQDVNMADLRLRFDPKTPCDWAALAVAYAQRVGNDEPRPDAGKEAFQKAIAENSALAFRVPMLIGYFGVAGLVDAPPFAKQPILKVAIQHTFSGLATEDVSYSFTISRANTDAPVVSGHSGTTTVQTLSGTIDTALVQALGTTLTDFIPVRNQFQLINCTDDYPDWMVTLSFKDGTTLILVTNGSNIYFSGGPWQTKIGRQNYLQYSRVFLDALLKISNALNLPKDDTASMFCGGPPDPLPLAFGTPEPTQTTTP